MLSIIFQCHKSFAGFWIFMTWTLHQLQQEHILIKTSYGTHIKLTVCFWKKKTLQPKKAKQIHLYDSVISISVMRIIVSSFSHPIRLCVCVRFRMWAYLHSAVTVNSHLASANCFVSSPIIVHLLLLHFECSILLAESEFAYYIRVCVSACVYVCLCIHLWVCAWTRVC